MQETRVCSLGQEYTLEKEMATHSSILAWEIPWTASWQAPLSFAISWSLLKLMSIASVMASHSLSSPPPPAFNLSQHRGLLNESVLHIRRPKYRSFSFSISPSSEYPGLISFRISWLDLLAVQGTLKTLLQHHSSKASFFGAQLFSQSNSHIHT